MNATIWQLIALAATQTFRPVSHAELWQEGLDYADNVQGSLQIADEVGPYYAIVHWIAGDGAVHYDFHWNGGQHSITIKKETYEV